MSRFRELPVFQPGIIGIFTRGIDADRLTHAIKAVKAAYPAAVALGDPSSKARRQLALTILESLPDADQAKILDAYDERVSKGRAS